MMKTMTKMTGVCDVARTFYLNQNMTHKLYILFYFTLTTLTLLTKRFSLQEGF